MGNFTRKFTAEQAKEISDILNNGSFSKQPLNIGFQPINTTLSDKNYLSVVPSGNLVENGFELAQKLISELSKGKLQLSKLNYTSDYKPMVIEVAEDSLKNIKNLKVDFKRDDVKDVLTAISVNSRNDEVKKIDENNLGNLNRTLNKMGFDEIPKESFAVYCAGKQKK